MDPSRSPCGFLYKYTNVVKGWQRRWFAVDASAGALSYYLCEDSGQAPPPAGQAPRGSAQLDAAVVCPSDEDSRTFTVHCASGDALKLRAHDARERQEWVDALRAVAEATRTRGGRAVPPRERMAVRSAMDEVRRQLQETELSHARLARAIEAAAPPFSHADPDLLLLKATSAASVTCLLHCLGILHRQQQIASSTTAAAAGGAADVDPDSVF